MKKILIITAALAASLSLNAQNEVDALRYSQLIPGGTARFNSLAGAFGALGADFSTLSTNPAGLGVYKKSEFTFTPSLYLGKTTSTYQTRTGEDLKYNFNLGNAGLVMVMPAGKALSESGWRNIQFGVGLNRLNNYNNRMLIEGFNPNSSLLDAYVNYANGIAPSELNEFDTRLAFDTWLLDTLGSNTSYFGAVPAGNVLQRKSITTDGSLNEFVLSMGANYKDRFYLGASLGFPFLRYYETSTYRESDSQGAISDFKEFTLNDEYLARGSGFNFKLGMIFRPTEWLRLGTALHTPTFFQINETYSTSISSEFDNGDYYTASSPNGEFDYKLETPMRFIGSIAFVIGEYGLVSADYEFLDYSDARLRSKSYKYFDENDAIRNSYVQAHNIRLGTEWRIDAFSFRGGYAIYGNPFESKINDGSRNLLSFGLGYREKNYFLDFAYVMAKGSEDYYLYDPVLVSPAVNDLQQNSFLVTLGFRY